MNIVILQGRLTKDCDITYSSTGMVIARFSIAVDRPKKSNTEKREADFINCLIWGKPAELLGNSVHKGQRVLIEGRLQIRKYKDKDGNSRTAAEVVCNSFEYIEKKEQASGFGQMGDRTPFDEVVPF